MIIDVALPSIAQYSPATLPMNVAVFSPFRGNPLRRPTVGQGQSEKNCPKNTTQISLDTEHEVVYACHD